jgi:hypothetical protein
MMGFPFKLFGRNLAPFVENFVRSYPLPDESGHVFILDDIDADMASAFHHALDADGRELVGGIGVEPVEYTDRISTILDRGIPTVT